MAKRARFFRGPRLRSIALVACALLPQAAAQKGGKPSAKEITRELQELYDSDQKDQNDPAWTETNDVEFIRRQKVRRDRVMEILRAGMLTEVRDWDHAAMLLQHGQSADDYLLAHVLSVPPGIAAGPNARFLCAATLDRFLQSCGRAQIFTTQSGAADPNVYAPCEPFDDSMSEALRAVFELKPLPRATKDGAKPAKKEKGPSTKDLAGFAKLAQPLAAGAEAPPWLSGTRALVLAGALESEKDYTLAARVLLASAEPDDLLSAHVLAMAVAFKSKGKERLLCAETLDRLLLALGRPQAFDTARANGKALEPRAPLADFIRREFGAL